MTNNKKTKDIIQEDNQTSPDKLPKNVNLQKQSRLNLLYILLTLKNYSSAKHPMSISELLKKVNHTFKEAGENLTINTSTITRLLEPLRNNENFCFPDADDKCIYSDPHNLGFCLYCVVKIRDEWVAYDPEKHEKLKKHYYCESIFSDAELKTLIDAIEIYNYFSPTDILTLIHKLLSLNPTSSLTNVTHLPDRWLKSTDSSVLNNIENFYRLIEEKKFAKITYYNYGYVDNKIKLVPRPGYPRVIRPISMMWSNGYYYLIAMLGKTPNFTPTNLRIDRIVFEDEYEASPEELQEFQPPCELSPTVYRYKHPIMFGGKEENITMLCRETPYNGMLNAVMDTFGNQANYRLATKDELEKYIGSETSDCPNTREKWIHIRVKTTTGGVELFATQYCRNCRVISPETVVERVKQNLEYGMNLYS